MKEELRKKLEEIVNECEKKGSIEDIMKEILKADSNYEISIKSKDGKKSEIKIEGNKLSIINGLANLLDSMIEINVINSYELDEISKAVIDKNEKRRI